MLLFIIFKWIYIFFYSIILYYFIFIYLNLNFKTLKTTENEKSTQQNYKN